MQELLKNGFKKDEVLTEDIPSRTLWQLIIGLVLTVAIFLNHFLLSHSNVIR